MKQRQRIKNDRATMQRREMADKEMSYSRDKNDALTEERRSETDKTMIENRARNDEITANRREVKDANGPKGALAIFLLLLIILAIGSYFIFF